MFGISIFRDYPFLIQFQSFVTGSDDSGRDRMAGESASHTPAITQVTVSSVNLCLLLSEVVCFRAVWNEAVFHYLM